MQTDFSKSDGNNAVLDDSLQGRIYPRIPHLPGSKMTTSDQEAEAWQIRACCRSLRSAKDRVVVQEKLDGSCMAVAKIRGEITPMARSGNRAAISRYEQHRVFHKWVYQNLERFDGLLNENEICFGEWLMQAHGTRYSLPHEPFVIFDLKSNDRFVTCEVLLERTAPFRFVTPRIIHEGPPLSVEEAVKLLKHSGHGAIDPTEGAIWRVECDGHVDVLAKYVRPDKTIGCFLPEHPGEKAVWNWRPA
ncbi:MAG TPA: RNA ligase family protein [Verrucomicrobiae bacterium]|nr:RNA ligase family protein [Verrucomicrobiae bacterium]